MAAESPNEVDGGRSNPSLDCHPVVCCLWRFQMLVWATSKIEVVVVFTVFFFPSLLYKKYLFLKMAAGTGM